MPAFPTKALPTRPWFWRLTMIAAVLTLMVGIALMNALPLSSVPTMQEKIDSYQPILAGLRILVIASLAWFWPTIIQRYNRSNPGSSEPSAERLALRWRVAGWLLIIELVIGHRLIGRLLGTVLESAS